MRSFEQRVIEPEILDTLPAEAAQASLRDLVRLNRYFGGHSALRHAALEAGVGRGDRVLDVGAASGDMGRALERFVPDVHVMSIDRDLSHVAGAKPPRAVADAFRLPFADGWFDHVYSSLFLHHFTSEDVIRLFKEMKRVSRGTVFAVDLRRHRIAHAFVPATRWLFGWDPVTVHDAAISVAAGFVTEELAMLAREAGLKGVSARSWGLSFRLTVVGRVNQSGVRHF